MVAQLEVVGIGQFQNEADASVFHGEDDQGQVALGSVGKAVGAVAIEGFLDLEASAVDGDGGVAGVGHGIHLEDAAIRRGMGTNDVNYNSPCIGLFSSRRAVGAPSADIGAEIQPGISVDAVETTARTRKSSWNAWKSAGLKGSGWSLILGTRLMAGDGLPVAAGTQRSR